MRIISKFSDYYDAGMGQGQDRAVTFLRESVRLEFGGARRDLGKLPPQLLPFAQFETAHRIGSLDITSPSKTHRSLHIQFGMLFFAGKAYPFAQARRERRDVSGLGLAEADPLFLWDFEQVKQLASEHDFDVEAARKPRTPWILAAHRKTGDNSVKNFFGLKGDARLLEHAVEHNLPIVACAPQVTVGLMRRSLEITINPVLKDIQFYRQMQPYEAFQELSMWCGNQAAPDRIPVVIEDKYRVAQHGFDGMSFRKRPQQ